MFSPIPDMRNGLVKNEAQFRVFSNHFRGVWKSYEKLTRVFGLASQAIIILGEIQSKSSSNLR